MRRLQTWLVVITLLVVGLSSCGRAEQPPTTTPVVTEAVQITPSPTPQPTPTDAIPVGILLKPGGVSQVLGSGWESLIKEQLRGEGLRYQTRETLTQADFEQDQILYVVVLPPYPGFAELAASQPETSFLAVGFDELEPAENLSVIRSGEDKLDVQGFVAGYIAAMITPDWRVAAVGLSEDPAAEAARQGFVAGAKYLCGLCLPKYAPTGPNYLYPKYVELAPDASAAEKQGTVEVLVNRAVETFYVIPGAADPPLLDYLLSSGAVLIGDGSDFQAEYSGQWAASLSFDFNGALQEYLPQFLEGDTGTEVQVPLMITDVNPELLSPGKLRAAEQILEQVSAGWISTSQE